MQQRNKKYRNRGSRNKLTSNIDPRNLVKKATASTEVKYESSIGFEEMNLHHNLLQNIANKGYTKPTEIQEKSIPQLMGKRDLIGIAATGTGKTGAFLIPIINQFLDNKRTSAIVVVPTRELAQQVHAEFCSLTKGLHFGAACFIGGTSVNKDVALAKRNLPFIVATPGRLTDLMNRRAVNLSRTNTLVLDEFDRMLDMGFINDVRKIAAAMKNRSQTILFSATIDKSQERLIDELVHNPERVNVSSGLSASERVNQDIIKVEGSENKFDVLLKLLHKPSFEKVILFTETKHAADKLRKKLVSSGLTSDVIHGNKTQNYRTKAIHSFKTGKTKILVATDVAARGIDIDNVSHVINYQLPRTMDSYIHRIGRTGRAGKTGSAYTFIN